MLFVSEFEHASLASMLTTTRPTRLDLAGVTVAIVDEAEVAVHDDLAIRAAAGLKLVVGSGNGGRRQEVQRGDEREDTGLFHTYSPFVRRCGFRDSASGTRAKVECSRIAP